MIPESPRDRFAPPAFEAQPTRREAETRLQIREKRKLAERQMIADWRGKHPGSPVSDATALILAALEDQYGHMAPPVPRPHCATCVCHGRPS